MSSWPNLPRHNPVQGQALGIHQAGVFPAPANSVSPAAVPGTSLGCHTFVRNVQSHFLRAVVEGRARVRETGLLPAVDLVLSYPFLSWSHRVGGR